MRRERRLSRCDSVSSSRCGIFVLLIIIRPFSGVFGTKGSIGTRCSALLPGINRRPNCAREERDLRAFAKKAGYKVVGVWKEIASGAKHERAELKKVLALAQARKVDVILVTELTLWSRFPGLIKGFDVILRTLLRQPHSYSALDTGSSLRHPRSGDHECR